MNPSVTRNAHNRIATNTLPANASATLEMHAGCMQAACSLHAACYILHAACYILHAGCCNLQPPAYHRMQAAWSLHEACMQAATSCMQPAATCNLLHTIVFTKGATISTDFRRPRRAGCRPRRAGRRRPSNQSEFYDEASCSLCTFDFLSHSWQSNSFSPVWIPNSTTHK